MEYFASILSASSAVVGVLGEVTRIESGEETLGLRLGGIDAVLIGVKSGFGGRCEAKWRLGFEWAL